MAGNIFSSVGDLLTALLLLSIELGFLLLFSLAIKRLLRRLKIPMQSDQPVVDLRVNSDLEPMAIDSNFSELVCESSPLGLAYSFRVKDTEEHEAENNCSTFDTANKLGISSKSMTTGNL